MKIRALIALTCATVSLHTLNDHAKAAGDLSEPGSFYFKAKGGYNRAAKRKISYSGIHGIVSDDAIASVINKSELQDLREKLQLVKEKADVLYPSTSYASAQDTMDSFKIYATNAKDASSDPDLTPSSEYTDANTAMDAMDAKVTSALDAVNAVAAEFYHVHLLAEAAASAAYAEYSSILDSSEPAAQAAYYAYDQYQEASWRAQYMANALYVPNHEYDKDTIYYTNSNTNINSSAYYIDDYIKDAVNAEAALLKSDIKVQIQDEEFDSISGAVFDGAIGYRVYDTMRAEISYSYSGGHMKHVDKNKVTTELKTKNYELMVASYYDLKINEYFTQFIGIGCGYSLGRTNITNLDNTAIGGHINSLHDGVKFKTEKGVASKLEAGVQFLISDGIALEGSYALKATLYGSPTVQSKTPKSKPPYLYSGGVLISTDDISFERNKNSAISHQISAGVSFAF